MAVPVTVPPLALDDGQGRLAAWYQPDGATVRRGDLVYRLETDFAAIEVEADDDGVFRHAASAGASLAGGGLVGYILAPGESLPGEKPPAEPEPPPKPRRRQKVYPLADVLQASQAADTESPLPEGLPWDPFPPDAASPEDVFEAPKPLLLFPRIVNEIKEEAAADPQDLEPEGPLPDPAAEPQPTILRDSVAAWELLPGETDFNPDWLLEPPTASGASAAETANEAKERFQASNIRSLALGRAAAVAADAQPEGSEDSEPPPGPGPAPSLPASELPPPAVPPGVHALNLDQLEERRIDHPPGQPLFARITVDVTEAGKMRDELTREWMGSNIRPTDEDIVLRAIARALHESAAFRRRTDVVGVRPLNGASRSVHLLADAATRPFRDAVASLAALRDTPGAELACLCTLTNYGDFGLDDATPALLAGQPLAFAMGAVREIPRLRGDRPQRALVLTLTLSYDSDAMPDGAAARLLSRVCGLVEAPYALLAD